MNSALMFGKATDEWETPQAFFDGLAVEFNFVLDVAATRGNTKCLEWFGPEQRTATKRDALDGPWAFAYQWAGVAWMNPPYSRCREFIAKAALEARKGVTTVALVPSRTDTRWWHEHVWDAAAHATRPGVEIRFIKGRLKFGDGKNSAPFPSVVIVFRPPSTA